MPSDPYSPQPDDRAARDEALARAFAPPQDPQQPLVHTPPPFGASVPNPYAPPAGDDALARAFAPPAQTPPFGAVPPGAVPPGAVPPGAVPPGAVPPGVPWGGGAWGGGAGPYGWQQPPMGPPTAWNGYAITSLVLGVLGLACCMWVGAIGFGVAALRTVKERNERGRGLAIAGIVLGGVWGVVLAVVMVLGLLLGDRGPLGDDPFRDGSGSGTSTSTGVFDLAAGECFVKLGGGRGEDLTDVDTVDCSEPHYGEVYATPRYTEHAYPGKDGVVAGAQKSCGEAIFDYAPDSWAIPEDTDIHFFYPDKATWALDDDHYATCFLTDGSAAAKGMVRQDRTALTDEQMAYLRAEHGVDRAYDEQPPGKPAADPAAYRDWAQKLSVAVDAEVGDLGRRSWGGSAAAPVGALKDELKQALTHLQTARTATDPKALERELAAAEELLGFERPAAVRAALGLATGDGRHDGGGAPGGVRTESPAPVADLRGPGHPSVTGGAPARA
ncbi:DUF4190 domain-containing protein [Streptomyces sp. NRRL B-24484]|uniref:DUF4190 domain-containing protein n=1 Tax=Streptomyces sp. NRRL B-24484 TaxID=1463833 RepID=UPI0004C24536|nr:DUF4190 domain-containing protein [Streptomyces sp. NRRL B-24484]